MTAPRVTSPQRYPLQYVDVVIPRFLAKAGDPKTEDLHQSAVEAALKKNQIKFDKSKLDAMFKEADFEGHGYLTKAHLIAAATGRYTKRQFGLTEWLVLISEVMDKPVHKLDSTVDMSAYFPRREESPAGEAEWWHNSLQPKAGQSGGSSGAPHPRRAPQPTSGQLTSLSAGDGGMQTAPSNNSRNVSEIRSSPSQQHSKQSLQRAGSNNGNATAAMVQGRPTAASSPRPNEDETAPRFTSGRLEASEHLSTSLTPKYQEYLDSVDLAYGGDELGYWTQRNPLHPPRTTAADFARRTKQLSETYPFDNSMPPSSLAKTRQSLNGFRPSSKPGFERFHKMLSPHDLDLKECLGHQIYPDPMGQTEPLRSDVTDTGLPEQDYVHIGSQVPPPKTFGCQEWWN